MVRILGNNLSNKKKIYIALTAIYGIGINTSKKILERLNIDPNSKAPDLSDKDVAALRELLETDEFQLEGDLKRVISLNIKRLIEISSVRLITEIMVIVVHRIRQGRKSPVNQSGRKTR